MTNATEYMRRYREKQRVMKQLKIQGVRFKQSDSLEDLRGLVKDFVAGETPIVHPEGKTEKQIVSAISFIFSVNPATRDVKVIPLPEL